MPKKPLNVDNAELEDDEIVDETDEAEDDTESKVDESAKGKDTEEAPEKPANNQEGYYLRQNKKLEKELATKERELKELRDERKTFNSKAELEAYNSVLDKLEEAGLPARYRKVIDPSWPVERIDENIAMLAKDYAPAKQDRPSEDEEKPAEKPSRATAQAGEKRPTPKGDKKPDLSHLPIGSAERVADAAKDI